MIKIGLTGSIASGKTLVESFLQEKEIATIDADKIVHNLFESDIDVINKVENLFFKSYGSVKNEKGTLSREKIGKIVFETPEMLKKLEEIVHPIVKEKIQEFFILHSDKSIVVVVIPLLFEAKMESMFDFTILVTVTPEIQIERLMKRNNFSREEALKRINIQMPQEEKIKKADFIIDNSGSVQNAKKQLKKILDKINL